MQRRVFLLSTVAVAAVATVFGVHGALAQAQRPKLIAYLRPTAYDAVLQEAFMRGMREQGYSDGRDFTLEARWSNADTGRTAAMAAELAAFKPDIYVASTADAGIELMKVAGATPIVLIGGTRGTLGLATYGPNLDRPNGNVTGIFNDPVYPHGAPGQLLLLMKEAMPAASRIGWLDWTQQVTDRPQRVTYMENAAKSVNVQAIRVELDSAADFEKAFQALKRENVQAVVLTATPLFTSERANLAALAIAAKLPSIGSSVSLAEGGIMMSGGLDNELMHQRTAAIVDKLLKGTKVADLPVQDPPVSLVLNMKTADAIGFKFPDAVAGRANRVIK